MKRILFIAFAILFMTLSVEGQDLFFIGEQSYPSTEIYTLKSNSSAADDLNVLFAKDGEKGLLGVSTKTFGVLIRGKLMIYLDNGTVIVLKDKGINDYVNEVASTVYYLTDEELSKMKDSNINTIRYTLEPEDGEVDAYGEEGDYSASNKGDSKIDFTVVVSEFFDTKRSGN